MWARPRELRLDSPRALTERTTRHPRPLRMNKGANTGASGGGRAPVSSIPRRRKSANSETVTNTHRLSRKVTFTHLLMRQISLGDPQGARNSAGWGSTGPLWGPGGREVRCRREA